MQPDPQHVDPRRQDRLSRMLTLSRCLDGHISYWETQQGLSLTWTLTRSGRFLHSSKMTPAAQQVSPMATHTRLHSACHLPHTHAYLRHASCGSTESFSLGQVRCVPTSYHGELWITMAINMIPVTGYLDHVSVPAVTLAQYTGHPRLHDRPRFGSLCQGT